MEKHPNKFGTELDDEEELSFQVSRWLEVIQNYKSVTY